MQEQLKPCPFCGSCNVKIGGFFSPFCAYCKDCGAKGPPSKNWDLAALYWNAGSLEWTRTRPKKPGFYFYKSSEGQIIVTHIERLELVHLRGITAVMMVDGDVKQEIDRLPGLWAGLIPEPAE